MSIHDIKPGDLFEWRYKNNSLRPTEGERLLSSWTYNWVPIDSTALLISISCITRREYDKNIHKYAQKESELYMFLSKYGISTFRISDGTNAIDIESGFSGTYIHKLS